MPDIIVLDFLPAWRPGDQTCGTARIKIGAILLLGKYYSETTFEVSWFDADGHLFAPQPSQCGKSSGLMQTAPSSYTILLSEGGKLRETTAASVIGK